MEKQVVLITGCSSGIGLGLAVRLASDSQARFKVYATMRDLSKKERLLRCVKDCHVNTLEILQMDVTDQQSITATAGSIKEERVDILDCEPLIFHAVFTSKQFLFGTVCNAGVGLMGPLECHTYDSMKKIIEVNLFGTISTIQAFLPGMKLRKTGRIILSSSVGGLQGVPFNDVYCASKFAVEGLCESLAIVLQHFHIHVSLIECGPVSSNFMSNLQSCDPSDRTFQSLDSDTVSLYTRYLQHCHSIFQDVAQDTDDILQVYLEAIEAPVPSLRYFTTQFFMPLIRLKMPCASGSEYVQAMYKFVFSEMKPNEGH